MIKKLEYLQRMIPGASVEDILAEISYLELQDTENQLSEFIGLVKAGKKDCATDWLNAYLEQSEQLRHKDDISLEGLKTRIKMLEVQLSVMVNKIAELQHLAGEYRSMHWKEMNEVMGKLLSLRKEVLYLKMEKDGSFKEEYDAAEQDEKQYKNTPPPSEHSQRHKLNADENALLQKRYRQASKLCHPDLVAEELKSEAEHFFVALSKAYMANDLETVSHILTKLENGEVIFARASEVLSEYDMLRSTLNRLQSEVESRTTEFENLENSALIKTIRNIDQWDLYFSALRRRFKGEIVLLEKELEELM
ncbi:MAG: hypothetical protein C0592_11035 [Marinilabiliales bacterium]|nr:MAG: hypothetical protein C0592_11035 [Marinilabiliales bacterium]